jgi:aryl-alcohol dehydrogenase-like predicted oxidoreductase
LKLLKTDYLDIVLVHSNGEDEKIILQDNIFKTLSTFKQAGHIRAFGMSSKTIAGGMLTIDEADLAMVTFNPLYEDEQAIIHHAQKKQKGILIKKAFASGHLTNLDKSQADKSQSIEKTLEYIFQIQGVTSVIVGTINAAHLKQNIAALPIL